MGTRRKLRLAGLFCVQSRICTRLFFESHSFCQSYQEITRVPRRLRDELPSLRAAFSLPVAGSFGLWPKRVTVYNMARDNGQSLLWQVMGHRLNCGGTFTSFLGLQQMRPVKNILIGLQKSCKDSESRKRYGLWRSVR